MVEAKDKAAAETAEGWEDMSYRKDMFFAILKAELRNFQWQEGEKIKGGLRSRRVRAWMKRNEDVQLGEDGMQGKNSTRVRYF